MSRELQSQFARKLASDPTSKSTAHLILQTLQKAASEEMNSIERSERLSREDYAVYINARTDNSLPGTVE